MSHRVLCSSSLEVLDSFHFTAIDTYHLNDVVQICKQLANDPLMCNLFNS